MRDRTWSLPAFLLLAAATVAMGTAPSIAAQGGGPATGDTRSLSFGGRERTFRIHAPSPPGRATPMPLVFILHGGGGTGSGMERLTLGGFNRLADGDGFVAVYPDGVERH